MECNKEEAIRAKEVADTKMQNKDFSGAKKVALKAQQLYPDLENISQLLTVCDVHLSAESKSRVNDKNWYDILKVESTADDITIKKQYRKFALLLHPDKNKFPGATDAFKLVGEAQRVLLDSEKRASYDSKLKNWRPSSNIPSNRTHPWAQNPFMGKTTSAFTSFNPLQQQPKKPPQTTFWTMCPYCAMKYQYYREVVNKVVCCQRCKKSFTGHEITNNATTSHAPWTLPKFDTPTKMSVPRTATSKFKAGEDSKTKKPKKTEISAKVNVSKRKKQIEESSESCGDDSSSESEEDAVIQENRDIEMKNFRRSDRSKRTRSYKENISDKEDLGSSSKNAKSSFHKNKSSGLEKEPPQTNKFKVKPKETENSEGLSVMKNGGKRNIKTNRGISPTPTPDEASIPEIYDYPDPEFSDFTKDKKEECFAVGQIWAAYDTLDAMPRFYARINKIISTFTLKLRITWLEPDPDDGNEIKWFESGLPVSCGEFIKGNTKTTDKRLMFSHLVDWKKGDKRDTYKIYPQKGETWALFRNWDINWYSDSEAKTKFEFDFVEILSEYCEDDGVSVAYLGKVKGFSCLFCRTTKGGIDSFKILRNQLFRFSHKVPSFRLSGEESNDVPKDSFELDPASFPPKVEEIDNPKDLKVEVETVVISEENEMELDSEGNSNSNEESPAAYKVPESEFFNFGGDKSPEKFKPGQIWALYSDEDGLPKYYALIKKVVQKPEFKLQVTWLSHCPTKNTTKNVNKSIPFGVGIFKHSKGKTSSYTDTKLFSHCLRVEPTDKKYEYGIYPRKGEVWAICKNWNPRITPPDLEKREYDLVEILEETDFGIKVLVLERVSGYKSVFKTREIDGALVVNQIDRSLFLRFSHQIPAFKLTDERKGNLKGYWELDPAALPIKVLSSR